MAEMITITADDGFVFSAYEAKPEMAAKGSIIILQEIFGVNDHIKDVAESYAAQGWYVLAPALFDRSAEGVSLAYNKDGVAAGREHKTAVDSHAEGDIAACLAYCNADGPRVVIGYCWGGSLAWRMACRHDGPDIAIAYYGGEIPALINETPRCPVQAHFGEKDASIPMDGVHRFRDAHPEVETFIYDADHGFNCDHRPQYDEAASTLARQRVEQIITR